MQQTSWHTHAHIEQTMSKQQESGDDIGLNKVLEAWSREAGGRPLTMVMIGKSGVGKSTLINDFLELEEDEMCATGSGALTETREVVVKASEKLDITVQMIDTPGLGGIDEVRMIDVFKDLSKITNHKADIVLYCVSIHPSSCIDSTDIDIIQATTMAFGPEIWRHTILALTFAGAHTYNKPSSEYQSRVSNYANAFQEALHKANVHNISVKSILSEEVSPRSIPAIPIEGPSLEFSLNSNSCSDPEWTRRLFKEALKKSNPKIAKSLLKLNGKPSQVVQAAEFGGSIAAGTAVGAAIGTAIGAPFLGIGIIIGAAVGAVVGGAVGAVIPIVIKACKKHN